MNFCMHFSVYREEELNNAIPKSGQTEPTSDRLAGGTTAIRKMKDAQKKLGGNLFLDVLCDHFEVCNYDP